MKYLTERHFRQTKNIEEETIVNLNEEQIDTNCRQSLSNSLTSTMNFSHRPSILNNGKIHSNQWIPRASIVSLNNPIIDHVRSIRNLPQGQSDCVKDPIKHGVHIEFKFSTHFEKDQIENSGPQKSLSFCSNEMKFIYSIFFYVSSSIRFIKIIY